MKNINFGFQDSYTNSHLTPNLRALNFARLYLMFSNILNIVLLQFTPYYSEAFKIFLNLIVWPTTSIGLTATGFIMGYDFYTHYHISWHSWIKGKSKFYYTYFFYSFWIIIIGCISYAIFQNTNPNFLSNVCCSKLDQFNSLSQSNYGWTNNPNNWYGFLILYTLVPTQNFHTFGTIFPIIFFFFALIAPFIFNFMNKMKFSTCTTFVVILTVVAVFLSTWEDTFKANPSFKEQMPWYNYINIFTSWYLICYLFVAGFYVRKYTKVIPWKIALTIFLSICLSFFVIETTTDFLIKKSFNTFYIGTGACSLHVLILNILFINICASFKSKKEPSNFIHKINVINEKHQSFISDQIMLVGVISRMLIGLIFFKVILNFDIAFNNNQQLIVGSSVNKNIWGWILIPCALFTFGLVYSITHFKLYCFKQIEKLHINIKNKKLN
ncbi:hypothetical protein [Mycoplasmoides pirum]|uniref:hypothetical protein n=1 Tax=Mycoplasmoides pirum TaxID=2122 RepID=UPI0004827221|nr:hypothetical protein [Mycoplasmoides pirum]